MTLQELKTKVDSLLAKGIHPMTPVCRGMDREQTDGGVRPYFLGAEVSDVVEHSQNGTRILIL